MKKILMIFLVLIGLYLAFNFVLQVAFGKSATQEDVPEKINRLEFDVSSVNLTIIPEDRTNVKAELQGKGEVTVQRQGDTIKVEYKKEWHDFLPTFSGPKLKVYIPYDYQKDMEIKIGSGNVNFSGVSKTQPVQLKNFTLDMGSGNVKLKHLSVDKLQHEVSSGNLILQSMVAKSGNFDIRSGNVEMEQYSGELIAKLSSGRLDIQMDELTDSASISVNSGLVNLDLPTESDFTLKSKVGSGHLSYDFPLTVKNEDKGNLQGTHGSGKHNINVNVSSGKVHIY